jgi:hypothetical protein
MVDAIGRQARLVRREAMRLTRGYRRHHDHEIRHAMPLELDALDEAAGTALRPSFRRACPATEVVDAAPGR